MNITFCWYVNGGGWFQIQGNDVFVLQHSYWTTEHSWMIQTNYLAYRGLYCCQHGGWNPLRDHNIDLRGHISSRQMIVFLTFLILVLFKPWKTKQSRNGNNSLAELSLVVYLVNHPYVMQLFCTSSLSIITNLLSLTQCNLVVSFKSGQLQLCIIFRTISELLCKFCNQDLKLVPATCKLITVNCGGSSG